MNICIVRKCQIERENIGGNKSKDAAQKNTKAFLCKADLNTLNVILILTRYHSLPQTKMFWEKEKDAGVELVYESMKGH